MTSGDIVSAGSGSSEEGGCGIGRGPLCGPTKLREQKKKGGKPARIHHRQLLTDIYLYGYQDTWFDDEGLGTFYEITNTNGTVLYYAGTLCNGNGGPTCDIVLPPGEYLWRVYGAQDPHKSKVGWEFCDAHGSTESELWFLINEDGKCIPERWSAATDLMTDLGSKTLLFTGSLLLTSSTEVASLGSAESTLLQSVLAMVASEMSSSVTRVTQDTSVEVLSWHVVETNSLKMTSSGTTDNVPQSGSSADAGSVVNVEFSLTLPQGQGHSATAVLLELSHALKQSIESGFMLSNLITKASNEGVDALSDVTSIQLSGLQCDQVQQEKAAANASLTEDTNFAMIADAIIMVSILLGVVFGLLLFKYQQQSRPPLPSVRSKEDMSSPAAMYAEDKFSIDMSDHHMRIIPAEMMLQTIHDKIHSLSMRLNEELDEREVHGQDDVIYEEEEEEVEEGGEMGDTESNYNSSSCKEGHIEAQSNQ